MLEKVLQQLGLGNKEQTIYKLILERGKVAPALLSRLTKINRTTVYSVAKELKDKGLIVEDIGGKTLYYIPAREHELEKLIKIEKEKTHQKEQSVRELQELLKNTPQSTTYSVPKIRFVDEIDLENYLHESSPRWVENQQVIKQNTWWGFQDHTFAEVYEDWIDTFWKKAPKEIDLKLFSNKSEIEEKMKGKDIIRRQIKLWTGTGPFTGTQWVVGEYIILIVTAQKPYYLVEIHDAVMAHNMREVFKKLWREV